MKQVDKETIDDFVFPTNNFEHARQHEGEKCQKHVSIEKPHRLHEQYPRIITRYCKAATVNSKGSASNSPLAKNKVVLAKRRDCNQFTSMKMIFMVQIIKRTSVMKEKVQKDYDLLGCQECNVTPKIFHGELDRKKCNKGLKHKRRTPCQNNTINIKE